MAVQSPIPSPKKRTRLEFKLVLFFITFSLGLSVVLSLVCYFANKNKYITFYSQKTQEIVAHAATFVDGDRIATYLDSGEKDSAYAALQIQLNTIKKVYDLKYLFVFKPGNDLLTYIIEATKPGDNLADIANLGDTDPYPANFKALLFADIAAKRASNYPISENDQYGFVTSAWAPILNANGDVVAVVEADLSMSQVLDALNHFVIVIVAIIFSGVSLSVLLLLWVVSRSVTRPINRLTVGVAQVDGGNLDPAFEIHTGDEIEDLANAFIKMTDKIKAYIINLAAETAKRERITSELAVAAQIQRDLLPNVFPAFPANSCFDIYAEMHAAREIGGDFYDFFLIGEDKLAFVVADVSGKGIPAALFMMMAKTIIKTNALSGYPVNEVLARANNTLFENNETSMFVTAFLGILDFNTGELSYANAGHNPPLIRNAQGNYEWLPVKHGFVLAGLQNVKYTRQEIQLARSQRIFCYTDGVTEAVNGNQELYSDRRLIDTLNLNKDLPTITDLIGSVIKAIDAFTAGAEQADDITLLAVEFKAKST